MQQRDSIVALRRTSSGDIVRADSTVPRGAAAPSRSNAHKTRGAGFSAVNGTVVADIRRLASSRGGTAGMGKQASLAASLEYDVAAVGMAFNKAERQRSMTVDVILLSINAARRV